MKSWALYWALSSAALRGERDQSSSCLPSPFPNMSPACTTTQSPCRLQPDPAKKANAGRGTALVTRGCLSEEPADNAGREKYPSLQKNGHRVAFWNRCLMIMDQDAAGALSFTSQNNTPFISCHLEQLSSSHFGFQNNLRIYKQVL